MAWQVPLSSSGMIDLGETDSVFVGRTVQLSSNLEYAVRGIGSNHQALIHGTVAGASSGIILGDFPSVDINNQLTVEAGGQIFGFGFFGVAVLGSNSQVINRGEIFGRDLGVVFGGTSTSTESRIENSGSITSDQHAINREQGAFNTEAVIVINTGIISGDVRSFSSEGVGRNTVINSGQMVGDIHFGDGADLYDGGNGRLDGEVFGGAGADRLFGGIDADLLDGGADVDVLNGGGGADLMKGGGAGDTYYVDNAGDVVDETGGNGIDRVYSTVTVSLVDTVHVKGVVEHLNLLGTANVNGTGNGAANAIVGNVGANTLRGGGLGDTLTGSGGNDVLFGDSGTDRLNGGTGMDTLSGGDAVRDTFVFLFGDSSILGTTVDRIQDWSAADAIDTAFAGTSGASSNYAEYATTVRTIEGAAQFAEGQAGPGVVHAFLYNQARDIGFLVSDLDRNSVFETGVILFGAGAAGDFDFANLV